MKSKYKWRLAVTFLQGSKRFFIPAILCAVGIVLTDMITPQIVRVTVDSVLGNAPFDLPASLMPLVERMGGAEGLRGRLWAVSVCILINALFAVLFHYGFRTLNTLGAETLVQTMRNQLFRHLERLPSSWYQNRQTGDIIQRCTSDVGQIKDFLSEQITSVFRIVILLVLSLFFMFSMHVPLALIALSCMPVVLLLSLFFHRFVSKKFTVCDENEGQLSAIVQENLTGVRVVRAFGREAYETEKFDRQNNEYAASWHRVIRLFCLYWGSAELITGVQILLLVVFGSVFCIRGEMTPGEFLAFFSYNSYLIWPIRQLGRTISEMSKAGVSLGRIEEIMRASEEQDAALCREGDFHGDIVFDHVTYAYDGGSRVLEDVSFTVPAGHTVGILGGTGSGKSTLIRLLDRLYELPPECGRITVGGTDIREMRASWIRRHVGVVQQEPFLFSRTVAENLRIAKSDASDGELREAAGIACVDETIRSFPAGYDTAVGERGVTLSGGQKQRTAIARTLVQQTPVLVFDDSLSAVDAETDARIRMGLQNKWKNSTVILISHRTSTLMHTDWIVVLDRGRVAEQGTHAQLLAANGLYRRIYDIQNGTEEATHA